MERRPHRGGDRRHTHRPRGDYAVPGRGAAGGRGAVRDGERSAADHPRDRGAAQPAGRRDDCLGGAGRGREFGKDRRRTLMGVSVVMPALEMAQETGKLVAWLKKEGEHVRKGDLLLEVETDKAVV